MTPRRSEAGFASIMVALLLVALMTYVALAVDIGNGRDQRRQAKAAADSAALAGAASLSTSVVAARTIALAYATSDGYPGATMNSPPLTGAQAGNASCVEVLTAASVPANFAGMIGVKTLAVGGRAVACTSVGAGPKFDIIALNATACPGINNNGNNMTLNLAGGVYVNSTCHTGSDAFFNNGNNAHYALVPGIDIAGAGTLNQNGSWSGTPPTVLTGQAPIVDPYAALSAPSVVGLPVRACPGASPYAAGYYNCKLTLNADSVFQAGDYNITGGIDNEGASNVTFGAGNYTLGGTPAFFDNNNGTTWSGAGVTIFPITGVFEFNGNSTKWDVTAPAAGMYAGIGVFQPRANTHQVFFNGNSMTGSGSGVIYSPGAQIFFNGNGMAVSFALVADTIYNNANNFDFTSANAGVAGPSVGGGGVTLQE